GLRSAPLADVVRGFREVERRRSQVRPLRRDVHDVEARAQLEGELASDSARGLRVLGEVGSEYEVTHVHAASAHPFRARGDVARDLLARRRVSSRLTPMASFGRLFFLFLP